MKEPAFLVADSLVQFTRNYHAEFRNLYEEEFIVMLALHQIGAEHFADFSVQVAAGYVPVGFSGRYKGLFANYAFALNFPAGIVRIHNVPVASFKTDRMVAVVFDGNPVGKHIMGLRRVTMRWLVESLYTHFNPRCYFCE